MCFAAFAAVDGLGWVGNGPYVVGNGWDVMVKGLMLLGGIFYIFFQVLRLIGRKSI